jgi:hypothetical protein
MQFLWESFNIKTFPANTVVFMDGKFMSDLSMFETGILTASDNSVDILKSGKLPVHIISVGEISGSMKLEINIANNQVFMSMKTIFKKPAEINIFIKNAGENATLKGNFLLKNESDLVFNIFNEHYAENTGIFTKIKAICGSKSSTALRGTAYIREGSKSDISLTALCAPDVKSISFRPEQRIYGVPNSADHSAAIWRGTEPQIEFLREAGLSKIEIDRVLQEAFESDEF